MLWGCANLLFKPNHSKSGNQLSMVDSGKHFSELSDRTIIEAQGLTSAELVEKETQGKHLSELSDRTVL